MMIPLFTTRIGQREWLIVLLLLGIAGCAHRESAVSLPLQSPPPFSASGQATVPSRWWTTLDDSGLNYQIDRSLGGSFELAAALERLRASRALVRREASDLWFDVNGVADAEGTVLTNGPNQSLFALGLDASYEVDLWDRIESRVEAEELRASATEADYFAVALTLSAQIARTWYALIEAHAQLALLDEQMNTNTNGLKAQELRFGRGFIRSADVFRQRQLVESTREQIVVVRSQIEVLEHQLAILQGRPPQGVRYETGSMFPQLPPLPVTGLPSELLTRRPDIRREYMALWAADRDVASAVSAQYPRLNLSGSLTTVAESPENLFRDWILVGAGQLIAPLIDGGQRRAEVDRNEAVLQLRIAEYGQTVLNAYREVENALARERFQFERLDSLNKQAVHARQAYNQLREQYLIGDAEYLDVLTAIQQEQRLQREILSARLELILIRISLYVALAGDFDTCPEFITNDSPANNDLDESPPEPTLLLPLAPDSQLGDSLSMPARRSGGRDHDDLPDGTDRPADRIDP